MDFNIIRNNLNKILGVWLYLILCVCVLNHIPNLPQRTHEIAFFITLNSCDTCGLGFKVNSLIITPIYHIISPFLIDMRHFVIFQKVIFIIAFSLVFLICININKKIDHYFKPVVCFLCLILFLNSSSDLFSMVPSLLGVGYDFLDFRFSVRTLFSMSIFIGFFFLIKNRIILAGGFFLTAGLIHPTNLVVIFFPAISFVIFEYFFIKNKNTKMNYVIFIFFLILGISGSIYKYFSFSHFLNDFVSTDTEIKDYIISMYRDEIDDFSALYQLTSHYYWVTILKLIFLIAPTFWYLMNLKKKFLNTNLLILIPFIYFSVILFFVLIFLELLYFEFNYGEFFIEKNISTQFGQRILQYTGLISIFFWFELAKFIFKENVKIKIFKRYQINLSTTLTVFLLFVLSVHIFQTIKIDNINALINFTSKEASKTNLASVSKSIVFQTMLDSGFKYEDLNKKFQINCSSSNMKTNYHIPQNLYNNDYSALFEQTKVNSDTNNIFVANYNQLRTRIEITNLITKKIPQKVGLITPPYLFCFREFLFNYDIFFQEHDDGNFMMGSKIIFEKFYTRMKLLGIDYLQLPTQNSKLNYSEMRKKWLALKEDTFLKISRANGKFKYLITEKNHNLNFKKIFSNIDWNVYLIE